MGLKKRTMAGITLLTLLCFGCAPRQPDGMGEVPAAGEAPAAEQELSTASDGASLSATTYLGEAVLIRSGKLANITRVYQSPDINQVPVFAKGHICFESGDNSTDIIKIRDRSGKLWQFAPPSLTQLENPRLDHTGTSLVFSAIGGNGKKGIYRIPFDYWAVYEMDQAQPVALVANEYHNYQPSLAKSLLAYVSEQSGAPQIHVLNLQSGKSRRLTNLKSAESPCVDSWEEWIYFTGTNDLGNIDIYRIKSDGSELTRLTDSEDYEYYPVLTRYDKWIAYAKGDKNDRALWIMSVNGKVNKPITMDNIWASVPHLNEDGTLIVFEGEISGKRGIYTAELDPAIFVGATSTAFAEGIDIKNEVSNINQFGKLTPAHLDKLSKHGFIVIPSDKKQLFFVYDDNKYQEIPHFVTADNLLHLVHIFFNTTLRNIEMELLGKLEEVAAALLQAGYSGILPGAGTAEREALRYLHVLYYLTSGQWHPAITAEDKTAVAAEVDLIQAQQTTQSVVIPGQQLDYSMFKVRGHYELNAQLQSYFKTMMWLGIVPLATETENQRERLFYLASLIDGQPAAREGLERIYRVTAYFVGESDDPGIMDLIDKWKELHDVNSISPGDYDEYKMTAALDALFRDFKPRIDSFFVDAALNRNKVLYVMGQRYVVDSHLFSTLFEKLGERFLPRGLDVFAAMNNKPALEIRSGSDEVRTAYPQYPQVINSFVPHLENLGEDPEEPVFNLWMNALRVYTNSFDKRVPSVFQTDHWQRKKLNTALGSWAELKHDTILYAKQTGAEMGGMEEPKPVISGYVEPELELYRNLKTMLVTMDAKLKELGTSGIHKLDRILFLVDFLITLTEKQLEGVPFTAQENEGLKSIGGYFENLTLQALGVKDGMRWFELESESARNMAVIADVFKYWGQYLLEGVGYADEIYVVVPAEGQLYLTRGAIFSYYEFLNSVRMSDSEWYKMLPGIYKDLEKRAPWYREYMEH